MNPTPVQRWLLLCAGFILLFTSGVARAQTPGVKPVVERAAGKCALCHSPLLTSWQNLPHGGSGRGPDGKTVATKPLACTACHPAGVLRGAPLAAAKATAVCGKCHLKDAPRSGVNLNAPAWTRSSHSKNGKTCLTCHLLHRPGDAPLLQRASDNLCLGCHAKGGKFAHKGAAVEDKGRASCTSCHDPHGGTEGGLYASKLGGEAWQLRKKYTHKPVGEGKCKACHEVHKTPVGQGSSGVVTGVVEDEDEDVDLSGVTPGVGGPNRSLLSKPPATICYECHGEKKELFLKSKHNVVGQRVKPPQDNACAACHLPHGSDYPKLTTLQGSRLCLSCHPDKTPHHFVVGAAVSQRQLECVECHNPHGTSNVAFLVRERQQICAKCHRK